MTHRRLVLAACLASATAVAFAFERTAHGSGRIVSEKRAAGGFDRVAVAGEFDVELHQGQVEGVELAGDDDLLALVETRVVEGSGGARTLKIAPRPDVDLVPTQRIRVRVDLVRITSVHLAGSSRVSAAGLRVDKLAVSMGGSGGLTLTGLDAQSLSFSLGGSGRVNADGRTKAAILSVAGSGRVALSGLVADDVSIDIAGSGSAEVQANQRLRVSIAGSGHVKYTGTAVPQVHVAGSGSVSRG
jgi:hypothetical protein